MTLSSQKKLAFALGTLVLLGGVFFIVAWTQPRHLQPSIPNLIPPEPAATANRWETPTYRVNEMISSTSSIQETGYKTMVNNYCHLIYDIPVDWSVFGFLGESQIISPKNERENVAWQEANREIIDNADGDGGLYPQNRSLVISCQKDTKAYLEYLFGFGGSEGFEDMQHLADLFATDAFHEKGPNLALVKTIKIDDVDAYEISSTGKIWNGTSTTTYEIVAEKGGVIYEISLDHIEYDDLSDTVKRIIQSISFEK